MELRQLQAFLTVADELHFGRAAEQLYMAQAPLSRMIQSLEAELGTRLFERNTRTVSLTPAGTALRGPAIEVLEAVKRAEQSIASVISGELGVVRIEYAGVAAQPIIATLARDVRDEHPGIRIDLSLQPYSRPSMARLVDGDIDLAFGRWDQVLPGISTRVLIYDSLTIAMPRSHPLAGENELTFGQVSKEPFVSLPFTQGAVTTDRLWRLGYDHGARIHNVQFAPDTQSCLALVSAGVGLHLAVASLAPVMAGSDLVFIPLAPEDTSKLPDVHLRAAWRTNERDAAVKYVLDRISRYELADEPSHSGPTNDGGLS